MHAYAQRLDLAAKPGDLLLLVANLVGDALQIAGGGVGKRLLAAQVPLCFGRCCAPVGKFLQQRIGAGGSYARPDCLEGLTGRRFCRLGRVDLAQQRCLALVQRPLLGLGQFDLLGTPAPRLHTAIHLPAQVFNLRAQEAVLAYKVGESLLLPRRLQALALDVGRERGARRRFAPGLAVRCRDLRGKLAQLALACQERVIAAAAFVAAGHRPARPDDLAVERDKRGARAAAKIVEGRACGRQILGHPDPVEQLLHGSLDGGLVFDQVDGIAEQPAALWRANRRLDVEPIQRQKGRATATLLLEHLDGRGGIVPPAGDDVLQRAAQRRLDGFVQPGGHTYLRRHRADNAAQALAATGLQDSTHAATVAGALALQALQHILARL